MVNMKKIKTKSIENIPHLVLLHDFGKPTKKGSGWKDFVRSLPDILAGRDFYTLVRTIVRTRKKGNPVVVGIGGHVIKCGVSPFLIQLMKKGMITGLALNGAAAIHDFEIALAGETSEDVSASLAKGDFGMVEETGCYMNKAMARGVKDGLGAGEALGRAIHVKKLPYRGSSILAAAYKLDIPVTVHIAIGTDIIHQHPAASGKVLGESTFKDFKTFCDLVIGMDKGGVYINIGSAVLLPEVFLKAVSVAHNFGHKLEYMWTADLDMIKSYRAVTNVVKRPHGSKVKSFSLIGHHEIMVPLLARSILEEID